MRIDILTLFPEMFDAMKSSMIGRAIQNGIIELNPLNIRDFSQDKHKKTDDTTFGGGAGMVMMPQPLFDALEHVNAHSKKVIYMSPRGKIIDKAKLDELSQEAALVIICGHYEGVDQRVLDAYNAEELSIGDYVLTGGELPAMVLIDAMTRLIPGVLSSRESALDESIYSGLLEYPQYTQPRNFRDMEVPEILLSGNHKMIDLWRLEQSLRLTKERRPDLFEDFVKKACTLPKNEQKLVARLIELL